MKFIRNNLPLANNKGFTLIELIITMAIGVIIVCLVLPCLIFFGGEPNYGGNAFTDKDGTRYYHCVSLPDEGVVKGVCAGLAYKYGLSSTTVRLGFVGFSLIGGAGVLAYAIIWLVTDTAHTPSDYLVRTGG